MNAIPTLYAGIRFRSRLEATWAAFFDLCHWPWTYEPMDLAGYIPDFVLRFPHEAVLAEVKPVLAEKETEQAKRTIETSGWDGDALILGVDLWITPFFHNGICLGWLAEHDLIYAANGDSPFAWGNALIGQCSEHIGLSHGEQGFHCRFCGINEGAPVTDKDHTLRGLMAKARNRTQWKSIG